MTVEDLSTETPELSSASQKSVLRDIRNFLAGQAEATRDETLLEETIKCTFCRVQLERDGTSTESAGAPVEDVASLFRTAFRKIRVAFPRTFDEEAELLLGPAQLDYVDRALRSIDLLNGDRDIIGDIYEVFMGAGYRGQEGQFFTPRNAVRALVEMVAPSSTEKVIDPACGAGGFLAETARWTGDMDTGGGIFGVEKDPYLARLARMHGGLLYEREFDVEAADSLAWGRNGFAATEIHKLMGDFDVVLTNPPFGSRIVAADAEVSDDFELAKSWRKDKASGKFAPTEKVATNTPPQVLFVERCLKLLRPGGRVGIVLPESVLSNHGHRYMVQYMLDQATPIAVIGMPESLFKTSGKGGTHTKVCLVVLEKSPPVPGHKIFMAEAKWCGHDSRGLAIPHDDIPTITERFSSFRAGRSIEEDRNGFLVPVDEIRDLVLAPRLYDPEPVKSMEALRATHDFHRIRDLEVAGHVALATGDEVGKLAYGTGDIPFVRTSDISSWEIKVDPKHGLSEEIYDRFAKKQDVRDGDILLVRDGTYLIGTCAMVTRHDEKIVYQSHLVKIRVAADAPFDKHLMLAALSSAPVQAQIKSLSFTQDIIDSLGDRIRDVVLAVPRDPAMREKISEEVKHSIDARVEARELARQARLDVVALT